MNIEVHLQVIEVHGLAYFCSALFSQIMIWQIHPLFISTFSHPSLFLNFAPSYSNNNSKPQQQWQQSMRKLPPQLFPLSFQYL